jgi:hypothetical protein
MNALSPDPIVPAEAQLGDGLPIKALVERLDPAARAAFHHERRRGRPEITALAFGVVENLWSGRRS